MQKKKTSFTNVSFTQLRKLCSNRAIRFPFSTQSVKTNSSHPSRAYLFLSQYKKMSLPVNSSIRTTKLNIPKTAMMTWSSQPHPIVSALSFWVLHCSAGTPCHPPKTANRICISSYVVRPDKRAMRICKANSMAPEAASRSERPTGEPYRAAKGENKKSRKNFSNAA